MFCILFCFGDHTVISVNKPEQLGSSKCYRRQKGRAKKKKKTATSGTERESACVRDMLGCKRVFVHHLRHTCF